VSIERRLYGSLLAGLAWIAFGPAHAQAQSSYYERIIFDNSLTPDRYFCTHVEVQQPSTVETMGARLPGGKYQHGVESSAAGCDD
jgi:hypothetical protein